MPRSISRGRVEIKVDSVISMSVAYEEVEGRKKEKEKEKEKE